jgi:hypothetical protein
MATTSASGAKFSITSASRARRSRLPGRPLLPCELRRLRAPRGRAYSPPPLRSVSCFPPVRGGRAPRSPSTIGAGAGGLNNRGFSTIARAICCATRRVRWCPPWTLECRQLHLAGSGVTRRERRARLPPGRQARPLARSWWSAPRFREHLQRKSKMKARCDRGSLSSQSFVRAGGNPCVFESGCYAG